VYSLTHYSEVQQVENLVEVGRMNLPTDR
jgi:hypothetical protein